jgi:hypothetical protein
MVPVEEERSKMMERNAAGQLPIDFIDQNGRRVLTDFGRPGLDGVHGVGSTSELVLADFASLLFNQAPRLDRQQFATLERWVAMCRPR